jgi:excinuclease ABC subunit C
MLQEKLNQLPDKPGVYLMRNLEGEIIYIGKASSLRNRVRSYFSSTQPSLRIRTLIKKIADFEYITTTSEVEALILEDNLIKHHKPRYNIRLKDDKRYPYLRITAEKFPRIEIVRHLGGDKARYFGPYTNPKALRQTLKLLGKIFPIRTCKNLNVERPCLKYHINRCLAPCVGLVDEKTYQEMVERFCLLLRGRGVKLLSKLKEKMEEASLREDFELAATLRDQIAALEKISYGKISFKGDYDAIGLACSGEVACAQVFLIREGLIIGRESFFLTSPGGADPKEILTAFAKQYYTGATNIPDQILLPYEIDDPALSSWLEVELKTPKRGPKHKLVRMVTQNAQLALAEHLRKGNKKEALEELKNCLRLKDIPRRIEALDISNIQGRGAVGSMVVFIDGLPQKSGYRRFKLKTKGPNDYAMIREVICRRFKDKDLPELLLIDGGQGQLNVALRTLRALGIEVPMVALAKSQQELFTKENKLTLPPRSLYLLQQIRDEAHRFALDYHRRLRGKITSLLDEVPGIGPKRKEALLKYFGSLKKIQKADLKDLLNVPGLPKSVAKNLHQFLKDLD